MRNRRIMRAAAATAAGVGAGVTGVRWGANRIRRHQVPELEQLLEPPIGVRHHRITTGDGSEIHLAEAGTGPAVLLLHGVTLQWWVWNTMFNLLSGEYRVIAWDMRGHGSSTVGSAGMDLVAIGDDIVTVIDELELVDPIIVGHSMGGMALLQFCLHHRDVLADSVGALVLLATSGDVLPSAVDGAVASVLGLLVAGEIADEHTVIDAPRRFSGLGVMGLAHVGTLVTRLAFGRHPSGTAIEHVRQMGAAMSADVTAEAIMSIGKHATNSSLRGVETPTAVVVGSRDLLTPPPHAKRMLGSFSNVTHHVLSGVGHQVMQEDPGALGEIIRELSGRIQRSEADRPPRSGRLRERR